MHEEAPQYRILLKGIDGFIDKIPSNPTRLEIDTFLHRELNNKELEVRRDGARIISEASKLSDYEQYRNRLSNFMTKYNELGVSALAQYIMHRKIILEFFEKAITLDKKKENYPLEKIVHDIIFPMKHTNEDIFISQQNLWIIDERLNYHSFVASDKSLKSINHLDNNSLKRPDLFIFDRKLAISEGDQPINSLTIVEFRAFFFYAEA